MNREISEGNKLIAEFDGWVYAPNVTNGNTGSYVKKCNGGTIYATLEMHNYHEDWNKLMMVVEDIKDIDNEANIEYAAKLDSFKKDHEGEGDNIFETSIFCHIEEVFRRVVVFIKWYLKK